MNADSTSVAERVFDAVATSAPAIRASLPGRRAYLDDENPSGESMLAADAHADDLLAERLTALDGVGAYASEEREEPIDAGDGVSVACDPLDGSSNIKSNNPMGTIVSVYDGPLPASGRDLLGAAYVLYGPVTTMVCARDGDAREYLVDEGDRDHLDDLSLPDEPTVYGFGGRVSDWPEAFARFAAEMEAELKLRYGGSMVGDVSQVLTYGGIFGYPALESAPEGKLRLQFEANPMGYIVEAAGGRSSDGERSVLDREPESLHGRTPVHLGNASLVDRLEDALDR